MSRYLSYIFFTVSSLVCLSQTNVPPPHVVNSAGGSVKIAGGNYYSYNIGEPIIGTTGNYYTQGFLQPDYKIATAFNANLYVGNESCQGANDGYIVINTYNNKGVVNYTLSGVTSGDTSSSYANLAPGTYTLTATDSTSRSLQKVITITASSDICAVHVHNAFSPNGDGINETFAIDGIENYPNNHVYIFNRWGQRIWQGKGYDNSSVAWNGKDEKGEVLFAGTYFYIIEIEGRKTLKGWVEITK